MSTLGILAESPKSTQTFSDGFPDSKQKKLSASTPIFMTRNSFSALLQIQPMAIIGAAARVFARFCLVKYLTKPTWRHRTSLVSLIFAKFQ
jgi:hypothetical protein